LDLAVSIRRSPTSSAFQGLISSSSQFGLTKGGFTAQTISLTEQGRSIVPSFETEYAQNLDKEFTKIFKSTYNELLK